MHDLVLPGYKNVRILLSFNLPDRRHPGRTVKVSVILCSFQVNIDSFSVSFGYFSLHGSDHHLNLQLTN